jgi:exodeoxyribonuclease VII large subunit
VRAATPSEAAELVVPDCAARAATLARTHTTLVRAMRARLIEDAHVVSRLRGKLGDPRFLIAEKQQYLDDLSLRLERRVGRDTVQRRAGLEALRSRLAARHPRAIVAEAKARLGPLSTRLSAALGLRMKSAEGVLGEVASRLDALSPLAVLSRGYSIATRADGRAVRSASEVEPGEEVTLRLHEGSLTATVRHTEGGAG